MATPDRSFHCIRCLFASAGLKYLGLRGGGWIYNYTRSSIESGNGHNSASLPLLLGVHGTGATRLVSRLWWCSSSAQPGSRVGRPSELSWFLGCCGSDLQPPRPSARSGEGTYEVVPWPRSSLNQTRVSFGAPLVSSWASSGRRLRIERGPIVAAQLPNAMRLPMSYPFMCKESRGSVEIAAITIDQFRRRCHDLLRRRS
jgi:hypothetical protein